MGMDRSVQFAPGKQPTWSAVSDRLRQAGFPVQLRMIDGQLAFPDEQPGDDWKELRLGTPQGMVSVRREPALVICVVWGNADAGLVQAWNAVTWAWAAAGAGRVDGSVSADDFRQTADLPPGLTH